MWRFRDLFVSRPSQKEPFQTTLWRFRFFWCVDLFPKNLPRRPCGVSAPRTFPENHVAFQVFFCASTFAPPTFPENHVAFRIFFCKSTFPTRTFPENDVAFQVLLVRRPLPQKPSRKTMWRFCTQNLARKPCGVSSFFLCVDLGT